MIYNIVYTCDNCKGEMEIPAHPKDNAEYNAGKCSCGGTYRHTGESYDQEFVEQEKYERRQDQEYEERHRYN